MSMHEPCASLREAGQVDITTAPGGCFGACVTSTTACRSSGLKCQCQASGLLAQSLVLFKADESFTLGSPLERDPG